MRSAFRPRSPAPAREAERTSTRVPAPHGVRRITTSSVNPNHRVVSVASMRPLDLSAVTISHPSACATASARSKVAAGGFGSVIGREIRIAVALEDGQLRRPVERVRGVPALGDDGLECRRVFEIGREVVNQRQALRAPLPRQRDRDGGQREDQRQRRYDRSAPFALAVGVHGATGSNQQRDEADVFRPAHDRVGRRQRRAEPMGGPGDAKHDQAERRDSKRDQWNQCHAT